MPDWKRELQERLDGLALDPARAVEIVEELSQHLAEHHAELLGAGLSPEEAERQTRAELRDHALVPNLGRLRQAATPPPVTLGAPRRRLLADLAQDVRYALRTLRRAPGYTAAAVLTLALGVGANSAIFSLVNATVLRELPAREPDRLVAIRTENAGGAFSYPDYVDIRDLQSLVKPVAAWGGITASLNRDGQTDLVAGLIVTGTFFDTLGVAPAMGRLLTSADDEVPGAHPVAVISHGLWQRRFGGRPDVVGRELLLNGRRFTVVGVTPRRFAAPEFGGARDLFVPMMMQAVMRPPRAGYSGDMDPDLLRVRNNGWLFLAGRLAPGASVEQARAALAPAGAAISQARSGPPRRLTALTFEAASAGPRAQMVSVAALLMSVVGAVLLLACANVANLSLSRAAARSREIAVRLAIGASGGRIVRQLLTESVLVAAAGGAVGLALAWWTLAALRASPPPAGTLPLPMDLAIDVRVLAFTLGLAVLAGVLFGMAPAFGAARTALVEALKAGQVGAAPRWRRLDLRGALVVGQVAVSLVLLVAAGLFLRSLQRTQAVQPGFDAERLLAAPLQINLLRYTRDQGREFYRRVVEDVRALPGVEGAGVARVAVLAGGGRVHSVHVEGRQGSDNQFRSEGGGYTPAGLDSVSVNVVDEGYFDTLGIARGAGRVFGPADHAQAPGVAVVTQAFERLHFPEGSEHDVVGRRISLSGPRGPWLEVVGVVADSKYRTLTEPPTPIAYVPLAQNHETGMTLYVRTTGDPAGLVAPVRAAVQALEPNLPLPDVLPMMDAIGASLYVARMGALLLGAFGGLALLLSAIGVYGVMAFAVSRRTREIGVRIALGAEKRTVLRLVVGDGMRLVAAGTLIGLFGAAVAAQSLQGFLYGVSSGDALTFAAVPVLLAAVALVACLVPARRAARVDPLVALRSE
ncbi:MAG TPA: ABC transporter permease [Vicinamibacteria bacterium]